MTPTNKQVRADNFTVKEGDCYIKQFRYTHSCIETQCQGHSFVVFCFDFTLFATTVCFSEDTISFSIVSRV